VDVPEHDLIVDDEDMPAPANNFNNLINPNFNSSGTNGANIIL